MLVKNLDVASHPEALDMDSKGKRIFANIADSNEVAVISAKTRAITDHWKLSKATHNVPMAYDEQHQLLYVACRVPGMLIAIDARSGKEVANVTTAEGADDLFYDPALQRIYVIDGAGEVDPYQLDNARSLHPLAIVPTASGAKTALFVPSQNLLYVGVPAAGQRSAEIRVYATSKTGEAR